VDQANREIKQEPLDEEEVPAVFSDYEEEEEEVVPPRPISNLKESVNQKLARHSIESNRSDASEFNLGASTSRDPRIRIPSSVANPAAAKRQAFLDATLKADDMLRGSSTKDLHYQPKQIQQIRRHTGDVQKIINQQSSTFYSNLPASPVTPTSNRSPVISNNHNAQFVSFATSENIRESLEAQRYRNISRNVQETAQRVGADLDSLSQRMRAPVQEVMISYSSNSRTLCTQTDPVDFATTSNGSGRKLDNKATQTTKNNGVFSITIDDLSKLNNAQRKALEEFKKLMNVRDEPSTRGLLERLEHRQADNAYRESRNNKNDRQRNNNDRDGSSERYSNAERYSNPPAPSSSSRTYQQSSYQSAPKRSKYANGMPK
jgi:hypothetical protein